MVERKTLFAILSSSIGVLFALFLGVYSTFMIIFAIGLRNRNYNPLPIIIICVIITILVTVSLGIFGYRLFKYKEKKGVLYPIIGLLSGGIWGFFLSGIITSSINYGLNFIINKYLLNPHAFDGFKFFISSFNYLFAIVGAFVGYKLMKRSNPQSPILNSKTFNQN